MQRYYYVREHEKILVGIYDMFDNLRVNKYLDPQRKTIDKTVKVPLVTHYSKDFANYLSSTTSKQILAVLPVAGLRYTGDSRDDPNMTQPTYAREIYCKDNDFWIRDIQPRAYVFKFELTILCNNTSDLWQLKENIQPYFQTYRSIRIKEFDFCPEIERVVPVCITGWSDEMRDETDLNSSGDGQVFQVTYQIEAHGVMHCPYMVPAEIRYAGMDFIVNKKMINTEQILVYPDAVAEQQRKPWETVSPSIKEGFSLLKSLARSLVRRSTVDGEEYWSDETLRYAMLTYNEITGYDRNGNMKGFNLVADASGETTVQDAWEPEYDENTGLPVYDAEGNPVMTEKYNEDGTRAQETVPVYAWKEVVIDDVERPDEVPSFDLLHLTFDEDSEFARDMSGLGRDFVAINPGNREFVPDIPPGNGSYAPDGYEPLGTEYNPDDPEHPRNWSQILEWFGDNKEGEIRSPFTFRAILQFKEDTPGDTVFQYLYNPEDVTLQDGTVVPAGEVWFDWGVMDSKLYFTYKTTTQYHTFETDTFEFDNKVIYSFYFVLYDSGKSGVFGVKTNLGDTMIALATHEVTE